MDNLIHEVEAEKEHMLKTLKAFESEMEHFLMSLKK